jgi:hypothetical protein
LFQRRIMVQLSIGIGLAGAVGVGQLLQGVLVRTEPTDLATLGALPHCSSQSR